MKRAKDLFVRVEVDYGGRENHGESRRPREVPSVMVKLFTVHDEDDVVWGYVSYSYDIGGLVGFDTTATSFFTDPLDCWRDFTGRNDRADWWMQKKLVACTAQYANRHKEVPPAHLLIMEHLARLDGLMWASLPGSTTAEKMLLRTLSHRLNGLIRAQNRSWYAMTGLPLPID